MAFISPRLFLRPSPRLSPSQVHGRLQPPVQGQANGKVKAAGIHSLSYGAVANALVKAPTCVFEIIISVSAPVGPCVRTRCCRCARRSGETLVPFYDARSAAGTGSSNSRHVLWRPFDILRSSYRSTIANYTVGYTTPVTGTESSTVRPLRAVV